MKTLLIKLSGEIFKDGHRSLIDSIVEQIKVLSTTCHIGIVVGGGNFFRGAREGARLDINRYTADTIGMLATVMNGLMLQDYLTSAGITCVLRNASRIHGIVEEVSKQALDDAMSNNAIIIFTGGTGLSHCSTDTAAVMRALQIGATTVLKATNVDGVYDAEPATNSNAQLIKNISHHQMLEKRLRILDLTAITWALEHKLTIRVFNLFENNALIQATQNNNFGSTIHP